ncbi:MAG: DoxX family protein [Ilumatobacteraceae bacterium]
MSKENFIVETLMFIGRILFAAIFVLSGVNHFTKAEAMTGYVQFKGVPQPKLANLVSGALLVASGLSIILGIVADLGALVASILLVVMAVMMHDFWKQSDPQAQQTEMIGFMKNISMAGGGLFMFAFMSLDGATYGPAITGSLFSTSL